MTNPIEREPHEPEIKVLSGPEILQQVSEEDLWRLMDTLTSHTHDAPKMIAQGVRSRAKEALMPLADIIGKSVPKAGDFVRRTAEVIYPHHTQKGEARWYLEKFKQDIAAGNTYILTVDGKVASTISVEEWRYKLKDGRSLYEFAKGVTLPEFEGHHYIDLVTAQAAASHMEKNPKAPFISVTKNPKVKRKCLASGFRELGIKEVNEMTNRLDRQRSEGSSDEDIAKRDAVWDREGYNAYLLDPEAS